MMTKKDTVMMARSIKIVYVLVCDVFESINYEINIKCQTIYFCSPFYDVVLVSLSYTKFWPVYTLKSIFEENRAFSRSKLLIHYN